VKHSLGWCGLLLLAVMARAEPGFVESLPADDFAAAGLRKLAPDELARLEALVQRYKTGAVSTAQVPAETSPSPPRPVPERKPAVEPQTPDAGAKTVAAPVKKQPGWFTALLTLNRANQKPEKEEPLESRLVGDFSGWNGREIFRLENGTRWVQQNKTESYVYAPVLHSPKVKITPAAIKGFWLEIEGVNRNVRVVPLELPEPK
jgi:hypothetical protein